MYELKSTPNQIRKHIMEEIPKERDPEVLADILTINKIPEILYQNIDEWIEWLPFSDIPFHEDLTMNKIIELKKEYEKPVYIPEIFIDIMNQINGFSLGWEYVITGEILEGRVPSSTFAKDGKWKEEYFRN